MMSALFNQVPQARQAQAGSSQRAEVRERPLRIAMIGQRGVPPTWGGIEHHVAHIGSRLAARGHHVTVFSRGNYVTDQWRHYRGMRIVNLPTIGTKHLDAIGHSGLSTLYALGGSYDVVHYHALGPGLLAPLPKRFSGARVVQTVHGLDHDRAKWGGLAQRVLGIAAWMSARVPNETIVVSRALAQHYSDRYGRAATFIPNGVEPRNHGPVSCLEPMGLKPGNYILFVGRLVPEKAPDLLVRAFAGIAGDRRLVLAGGSSFSDDYVKQVHRLAEQDPRIVLPGYVFGEDLTALYRHAAAFVLPSTVEGLPLTILEAAASGVPIIASDIAPHREVLEHSAPGRQLFPSGDEVALRDAITQALDHPVRVRDGATVLRGEVLHRYNWDAVTEATQALYHHAVRSRPRGAAA